MEEIRAPILTVLGHVDHGKTTLLDCIRGSVVAKKEPGQITQMIGCSFIPSNTIKKICGGLLEKFKVRIEIPGLLFIDTPGHEAFTSLRKRGGSIADLSILVIDINEGFQPQTDESLDFLKQFKVPFLVAATKIDKINGWRVNKGSSFLKSLEMQNENVKRELEEKIAKIIIQLVERGFDADRFDRIEDFRKKVAIIPCSGISGEGLPELLLVLCGLSQHFLKGKLKLGKKGKGNVLEIKEVRGIGLTADVILYDGSIERGDYLVIGGKIPIITKVKALLLPQPLKELRIEKKFLNVEKVNAACGVKIAALNLENVIAGSPFIVCKSENEIEDAKRELKKESETVEYEKEDEGVILKANSIGSLEALIHMAKKENIPIKKTEVGNVTKEDVIESSLVKDEKKRVIFSFNSKILEDAKELAKKLNVKIFSDNIIYKLFEDYKKWLEELKEKEIQEKLASIGRPVKLRVLKGCIFRSSKPCIVGVEIISGKLIPGVKLAKDNKFIGKVKEIQKEGENIQEANVNEKVAISMEEPTAKKDFFEDDILVSYLSENEIRILKELKSRLSESEIQLLEELEKKVS